MDDWVEIYVDCDSAVCSHPCHDVIKGLLVGPLDVPYDVDPPHLQYGPVEGVITGIDHDDGTPVSGLPDLPHDLPQVA